MQALQRVIPNRVPSSRNFGFLNSTVSVILSSAPPAATYSASSCHTTIAHRQLECTTLPGVGKNIRWTVTVDGRQGSPSADPSAFSPPELYRVANNTNLTTLGGASVALYGAELGPPGGTLSLSCSFSASNAPEVGYLAHPFAPTSCVVSSDDLAVCSAAPAFGAQLRWVLVPCLRLQCRAMPHGARADGHALVPWATARPALSSRPKRCWWPLATHLRSSAP